MLEVSEWCAGIDVSWHRDEDGNIIVLHGEDCQCGQHERD